MNTGCEISFGEGKDKKTYNDKNCNWYQKILMIKIKEERTFLDNMEKNKREPMDLVKQLGVVEYFAKQVPVYDENSLIYVNHMFGKGVPQASAIKHG